MSKLLKRLNDNQNKVTDTNSIMKFQAWDYGVAQDLTNKQITATIANAGGFLFDLYLVSNGTEIDLDFKTDQLQKLIPDTYFLEIRVTDEAGDVSVFPTEGYTIFTINKNLHTTEGALVPQITFDTVLENVGKTIDRKVADYTSTIVKGDKGDTGATGPAGDKGDKGDQGPKGDRGPQGSMGPTGDIGPTNQTAKNSSWIYNNIKPLSAHRGAHIDAPENTAMSVAHAGMYGYGLIECDPRLTSDNQVVLMHDDTVDRMTDGTGNVSNFTLGQLKQLTVDASFSGKNDYNTIRVPTLAEVLHEVNQYGMGVNIDGSKLDWQDDNVINTVVGIIKQAGLMGRSFFVISNSVARKRLNALYPEASLSWLNYDSIDNYIAEAKTYTNAVISISYGNLSRDYSAIATSGLPLHVYGVNSISQYYDSVQHGARFVETDSLLPMTVTQA